MFRILFVCTGNAGRSQMAAAFAGRIAPKDIEVTCAAEERTHVLSATIRVMGEIGLEISPLVTHSLHSVESVPFDVVVTLCNKAREICPTFPGSPALIHWPLRDPAKESVASEMHLEEELRKMRDDIRYRVEGLFQHGFLESIRQVRVTLGSLLDNLTDGVLAHDLDRRIFFFNRAAQRITGCDYAQVIGRDCHDVFPERFCGGDCAFCDGQSHTSQSKLRYPRTFIGKEGKRCDLEMSVVTIDTSNNDVTGALVIFRDVSEMIHLRRRLEQSRGFCGIVGRHALMQRIFDTIRELADINFPILIQGETGTGKEMVATALHQLSKRSSGPFVPVNCGALPEGTLESELFGHVRGAFTGAIHDRKGRFSLAEGGTIFLDEIGEISPAMQVKLLRVVQEKWFTPVGGEKNIHADVRVICASNRDLKLMTQRGLFREDLFYRLAVVPIRVPPLRDRRSDIPLLVEHFLDKFSSDAGKRVKGVTAEALAALMKYHWPGNVRELGNSIQYSMIKCHGEMLEVSDMPPEIFRGRAGAAASRPGRRPKLEEAVVANALQRAGRNRAQAARILGVSRTTLYRYLASRRTSHNAEA
ncbi:MAG: modulated sigma54 specific transcriptional regulator, Fis family [Acidobacteria bacterium]|nr:modulated sigma54 specific transcriptional regulator, Fis family [Acidobacteriota bacterium]